MWSLLSMSAIRACAQFATQGRTASVAR
jgi:hypothetical protein